MSARAASVLALGAALLCGSASAQGPASAGRDCEPWPGEPVPLPSRRDPDPVRARWAALRARELAELAERVQASARLDAHLLWSRVLCLDPGHASARAGLASTAPVRVHRPPVAVIEGLRPRPSRRQRDPWAELGRTVALYVDPPPPPPLAPPPPLPPPPEPAVDPAVFAAERERRLGAVEELLGQAATSVRGARFEAALERTGRARQQLSSLEPGDDLVAARVRVEVLAATAEVALGQREAAMQSFLRAIEADPELELDPRTTSPKVLHVLHAARAARGEPW